MSRIRTGPTAWRTPNYWKDEPAFVSSPRTPASRAIQPCSTARLTATWTERVRAFPRASHKRTSLGTAPTSRGLSLRAMRSCTSIAEV